MLTLHIEDDDNWAILAQRLLKEGGWESTFVHARTLEEANTAIRQCIPDFILCDLGLPDSGTLQTIEELPRMDEIAPVAVLSGHSKASYRGLCMDRGAMAYLTKEGYARTPAQFADACMHAKHNWSRIHCG